MKKFIYDLIRKGIKLFIKGEIISKKYDKYNKVLYYERGQHLTFLFQSKIKYEENIQNKLSQYIKKEDLVFDIGGNIGQYAIPFSELVGNKGRVISFEPDYKNFSFLQFNININRCTNVTCLNYGLGNNDIKQEFYRDTKTGGRMGSFKKEFVGNNFEGYTDTVIIKKFDSLISEYGIPAFVKIDVEGFEKEVLSGLTLNFQNSIFLIEVREETKNYIFNFFKEKGYQCLWVDGDDKLINSIEELPGFANLIFKNASR